MKTLHSLVAWIAGLSLLLSAPSVRADASIGASTHTRAQAIAAAKRLWSAVRARDRKRILAAAGPRVRMWAALAGLPVLDNHETDVERARFAELVVELELSDEPAIAWEPLAKPPLTTSGETVWIGAEVASRHGEEGHRQRIGSLAFGVQFTGGRALVIAFDVTYSESTQTQIYSR